MNTLEAFSFFVRTFVEKQRQDHYLSLAEKDWESICRRIGRIEQHLDERYCSLVEFDAWTMSRNILVQRQIKEGILISLSTGDLPVSEPVAYPVARIVKTEDIATLLYGEVIIVYPAPLLAFYFNRDGWVWVCDRMLKA